MNAPELFDADYFSDMVFALRMQRILSLREAAKEMGISHSTLSRIENGGKPDVDTFFVICKWAGWIKKMNAFYSSTKFMVP